MQALAGGMVESGMGAMFESGGWNDDGADDVDITTPAMQRLISMVQRYHEWYYPVEDEAW